MKKTLIAVALLMLSTAFTLSAQGYIFTDVVKVPVTSVKNQASSGTCWSYATAAFLEAELLRTGKGEHDLSEMFAVRLNYVNKINDNYLRRGRGNLGQGSLAHMFTNIVKSDGMIPQEAYNGINYDSKLNNHRELNKYISAFSAASVELKQKSPQYSILVKAILDTYLGIVPEKFTYNGKEYTPKSFAIEMGLNMDDYVEITSLSHLPFYKQSVIEVPDNWDYGKFWNVPLCEFMAIIDNALENGYSVCWDGDVSEKGFSHKNGVAINPVDDIKEEALKFEKIFPEVDVDQNKRQIGYENFTTTDDHLMLLTGISKDQSGNKYYITKNSWGTERNNFGGYLNMSESFVKAKSISIMVHKNSIPKDIRKKLNL
ncbi:MAG: C1 family peptidase [Bacteroidales bacterium]|jgi:bleomycin hydrolase|nr:C1 family peptidase [Bacteroidales bacterium]MDD3272655.1 C1 family peptidase [Bacteroidales bacterium]MDD4057301.1 C1 family peptidase [Bacteroidales bacterium]